MVIFWFLLIGMARYQLNVHDWFKMATLAKQKRDKWISIHVYSVPLETAYVPIDMYTAAHDRKNDWIQFFFRFTTRFDSLQALLLKLENLWLAHRVFIEATFNMRLHPDSLQIYFWFDQPRTIYLHKVRLVRKL